MENANDDSRKKQERNPQDSENQNFASKMSDRVTDWAGVERLESFNLGDVFSEAFKRHTSEEVEEVFTVGTRSTTPPIEQVETGWPRPWIFLRTFLGAAFIYFIFLQASSRQKTTPIPVAPSRPRDPPSSIGLPVVTPGPAKPTS